MGRGDKRKLDGEIQNNGLSEGSIRKCTQRYIEDQEKTKDFLTKAMKQGLFGLLKVPILLIMICVLYLQEEILPTKRGQIVKAVVDMYILRAQERGVRFKDKDKCCWIWANCRTRLSKEILTNYLSKRLFQSLF